MTDAAVHVGAIWKSPRDKTRCIQATIRSYKGAVFADFQMLTLDPGTGRMMPGNQRLTVSAKQLGKFSALVGSAYRKAVALGETT
jgi:hypothetical protein